jgi:ADP-ribosylglycohydrolase
MARALSRVTHTDRRAVEGAVYAAELCALCVGAKENVDRAALALRALAPVHCAAVRDAIDEAVHLATLRDEAPDLVQEGYVVDTLRACVWAFVRHGEAPLDGIRAAIALGGDTDTAAAIVGAWLGTLHGESSLPSALVEALHDGPFGPTHLRALSHAGDASSLPVYSGAFAWARNLALFPVVLVHGLTRVLSTLDPLG